MGDPHPTTIAELRRQHPNSILLFEVGSEWRCYGDDVPVVRRIVGAEVIPHEERIEALQLLVRGGCRVSLVQQI